jgi:hypothetical protein
MNLYLQYMNFKTGEMSRKELALIRKICALQIGVWRYLSTLVADVNTSYNLHITCICFCLRLRRFICSSIHTS